MEYPSNVAYGTTEDGESFVVEQKGAGKAGSQAARLVSHFFFFFNSIFGQSSIIDVFEQPELIGDENDGIDDRYRRQVCLPPGYVYLDTKCG